MCEVSRIEIWMSTSRGTLDMAPTFEMAHVCVEIWKQSLYLKN